MAEPVLPQLAKKVMLLIHFEAHLKGLCSQRLSPEVASVQNALEARLQPLETLQAPGLHVHRYLRTEAAHVFRLSNRTLQVAVSLKPSFSTPPTVNVLPVANRSCCSAQALRSVSALGLLLLLNIGSPVAMSLPFSLGSLGLTMLWVAECKC